MRYRILKEATYSVDDVIGVVQTGFMRAQMPNQHGRDTTIAHHTRNKPNDNLNLELVEVLIDPNPARDGDTCRHTATVTKNGEPDEDDGNPGLAGKHFNAPGKERLHNHSNECLCLRGDCLRR